MSEFIKKYRAWMLMALTLILNLVFGLVILLPAFQSYTQADERLQTAQVAIEATQQASGDNAILLQAQINRLSESVNTQVNGFVQENQVEDILKHLFQYADETGVVIENMQLQSGTATNSTVYTRTFQLTVTGDPALLMNFVVRFREASINGVQVQNPLLTRNGDRATLTMNVILMISPLADGSALEDIPVLELPVPVIFPTVAVPTLSPTPTVEMSAMDPVMGEPTFAIGAESAITPTPTLAFCGDAPVPIFARGDTVIVDFNNATTLRILDEPRLDGGDVNILTNVSDNAILQLIDGPLCGLWEGNNVWYWQVQSGGVIGWAGEANHLYRWMCPLDNPECA